MHEAKKSRPLVARLTWEERHPTTYVIDTVKTITELKNRLSEGSHVVGKRSADLAGTERQERTK